MTLFTERLIVEEDGSMYTETAYPVIDLVETGRCIERQRRQAGLTVRDLQAYFGFEYPQAIYKWQHGECLPWPGSCGCPWKTSWCMRTRGSLIFGNAFMKTKNPKQVFTCFGSLPRIPPMTVRGSPLPVNSLPSRHSRRRCLHNRAGRVPPGISCSFS